jgi:hypothetical protein
MLSLDAIRWHVICTATQRRPSRIELRSAAFHLLVAMLCHCQEYEWVVNHRHICWPTLREIVPVTDMGEGSIGWAREQLVAVGLVTRIDDLYKRAGADPVAAYRIHTEITHSPAQQAAAERITRERKRTRDANAERGTHLSVKKRAEILDRMLEQLNGHAWQR